MMLQIGEIKIKMDLGNNPYPDTAYFQNAFKTYGLQQKTSSDFEIAVESSINTLNFAEKIYTHFAISYFEEKHRIILFTQTSSCIIDWRDRTALLAFKSSVKRYDILLMDYIKLVLSFVAVERGGLPLHSSAVFNAEYGGIVYFCKSGGGKSTIASLLAPEWETLNDEFNLILPSNGGYFVHSTPFTAPLNFSRCTKGCSPIKKMFSIRKGCSNSIEDMAFAKKYLSLGSSVYTVPASRAISDQLLANMQEVCRRIPMQTLFFVNNKSIADDINLFVN
jgi:hypothetical protein